MWLMLLLLLLGIVFLQQAFIGWQLIVNASLKARLAEAKDRSATG